MSDTWYCQRDKQCCGPFKFEELRYLATRGKLMQQDLVRSSSDSPWMPASSVTGLFTVAAPASAKPTASSCPAPFAVPLKPAPPVLARSIIKAAVAPPPFTSRKRKNILLWSSFLIVLLLLLLFLLLLLLSGTIGAGGGQGGGQGQGIGSGQGDEQGPDAGGGTGRGADNDTGDKQRAEAGGAGAAASAAASGQAPGGQPQSSAPAPPPTKSSPSRSPAPAAKGSSALPAKKPLPRSNPFEIARIVPQPAAASATSAPSQNADQDSGASGGGGGGTSEFFGIRTVGRRVVYIVDCSGSMAGGRFQKASDELIASIDRLKSNQSFFVIFFSHQCFPMDVFAQKTPRLVQASRGNCAKAKQWIQSRKPSGGTDPTEAMAYAMMLEPNVIYMLTDGEIPPESSAAIQAGSHVQIPINTIAFGNPRGQTLLKDIAQRSGGVFKFIP